MGVRTRTQHTALAEGGDAKIEEYLDSLHVRYEFIPRANIGDFDVDRSERNNARFEAIDPKRVEAYAEAMKQGAEFPPTISYGKREAMIQADGNHRLQARIKARKQTMATYLLAKETPGETVTLIMHQMNAKHGMPTTEDERLSAAMHLIDNGTPARDAAAALSIPQRLVVAASAKRTMDQRFLDCGIAPGIVDKLGEGVKRRLSNITTDEGFVEAVDLAVKADLSSTEVNEVVKECNGFRSSSTQVKNIKEWKEYYSDRIQGSGGGTFTRAPRGPKARVGMALGAILALPEDITEVVKAYQGAEKDDAAKRIRLAARRLNEIARALSS